MGLPRPWWWAAFSLCTTATYNQGYSSIPLSRYHHDGKLKRTSSVQLIAPWGSYQMKEASSRLPKTRNINIWLSLTGAFTLYRSPLYYHSLCLFSSWNDNGMKWVFLFRIITVYHAYYYFVLSQYIISMHITMVLFAFGIFAKCVKCHFNVSTF